MKGLDVLIKNYEFSQEEAKRKLRAVMHHLPPGPCATCPEHQREVCKTMRVACEAFRVFVIHEKKNRWVRKPRKPNVRIYREIFWACSEGAVP